MQSPMLLQNIAQCPNKLNIGPAIGKAVLENPEMPLRLIQDTILSREEVKAGLATTYQFG